MSGTLRRVGVAQAALSLASALFGFATITAGARVLAGADPGYTVFRPLLLFNTAMGAAYLAAAVATLVSVSKGAAAAAAIALVNLLALGAVAYLRASGGAVAIDSVRAMAFRATVWLLLWIALAWLARRRASHRTPQRP